MKCIHILVKGKVQGVYYRATAKEVADKWSIKGWIRNLPDKNVEAVACGTEENLAHFIAWCKKGPGGARVVDVAIAERAEEAFTGFAIK